MTPEHFCRNIASDLWICLDLLLLFSSFSAVLLTTGEAVRIEIIHNLFHVYSFFSAGADRWGGGGGGVCSAERGRDGGTDETLRQRQTS